MRKLILLVGVTVTALLLSTPASGQVLPSWESQSGKLSFVPINNELSLYRNVDDAGENRGTTLQVIAINNFKLFTEFTFEFTADFNWDFTPGLARDHYIEIGLVKPVTNMFSLNVQRVVSTFEDESINQFGVRLRL